MLIAHAFRVAVSINIGITATICFPLRHQRRIYREPLYVSIPDMIRHRVINWSIQACVSDMVEKAVGTTTTYGVTRGTDGA